MPKSKQNVNRKNVEYILRLHLVNITCRHPGDIIMSPRWLWSGEHMVMLSVTWRRFNQSAKQLIVGHTTMLSVTILWRQQDLAQGGAQNDTEIMLVTVTHIRWHEICVPHVFLNIPFVFFNKMKKWTNFSSFGTRNPFGIGNRCHTLHSSKNKLLAVDGGSAPVSWQCWRELSSLSAFFVLQLFFFSWCECYIVWHINVLYMQNRVYPWL